MNEEADRTLLLSFHDIKFAFCEKILISKFKILLFAVNDLLFLRGAKLDLEFWTDL